MKNQKIISLFALLTLVLNALPVLAIDTSQIPACQFQSQPTPEQLSACQAAASAASQQNNQTTDTTPNNNPNQPTGIPSMPTIPEGGNNEGLAQAAEQIGAGLDQVRNGLLQAEEGLKEMKDGGINVQDTGKIVKQAREYYEQARVAYENEDFQKTGDYLKKIQDLKMEEKFAELEKKAISPDLINDIKKEMQTALKDMGNLKDADPEIDEIKAQLLMSLDRLANAESELKKGNGKEAASIMKSLRDLAPQDQASYAGGKIKGMSQKMMGKILSQINQGLTRGEKGINRAKANGLEPQAEMITLMSQARALYEAAQLAFDNEDYPGASAKLKDIQNLDLEQKFSAFKSEMLPLDRQKTLLKSVEDGLKALELTITHAKEAGLNTTELEELRDNLKSIFSKANEAISAKDLETFLTYMDEVDNLKISEQVDAIIKKLANAEIKNLVSDGLDKLRAVNSSLREAITKLSAKKISTDNANTVLLDLESEITKSQALFDNDDNIGAGKLLDNAVNSLISLVNIIRDSGVALAGERMKQINDIISLGAKGESGQIVVSGDKINQLDSIFATVGNDEALDMKQAFMQFDPGLMDKVIVQRQKDKKFMDAILRDVMPLIPASEREKMLEGKTGLLEEMAATDKTIAGLKSVKGLGVNSSKALIGIKEQIKAYNFSPDVAEVLDQKMSDFNDKVQSGEIKDPKIISSYITVLQEETAKAIKESIVQKMKSGILPAKNIDDNNPYFDEIKKLKDDGAIKPDVKGNIDLAKPMTAQSVADMINKTMDNVKIKNALPKAVTINDIGSMVFGAYGIKPNIDPKNQTQMSAFLKQIGADFSPAALKNKATLKDAADLIAAADNRWGQAD